MSAHTLKAIVLVLLCLVIPGGIAIGTAFAFRQLQKPTVEASTDTATS